MRSAAHPRQAAAVPEPPRDGEARACYGIVVACMSLLLLCALVSAVGVVKAFAATGVVVLLFGVVGWLAPVGSFVLAAPPPPGNASGSGTTSTPAAAGLHVRRCASCGLAAQAISTLPAFAYVAPSADNGGKARGSCVLCAVCLEDVQAGETVRQLPACGHLFHVDCIDMWLHAHRTCPLCRHDLSPQKVTEKAAATAASTAPSSASAHLLPPV
ncbi:hypothetical protein GUJ93_ZPchr0006g41258 [Zizania palustris]|uniref:RING-type E3 ubiquitin transferase n=1 Tax=Zizania palustris TaxID=103762 RepID=A0A8J5TFU2_ZIZPA|nr:hypothetical protein GUJ93_ZPchr0006g41258 [Zizania palustris]